MKIKLMPIDLAEWALPLEVFYSPNAIHIRLLVFEIAICYGCEHKWSRWNYGMMFPEGVYTRSCAKCGKVETKPFVIRKMGE